MAPIPVLLYHSVSRHPPPDGSWGAVTPDEFRRHVEVIEARGRRAVTVTELADALRGNRELPERPVGITFDDGYEDTFAAAELLRHAGLRATVFVTAGKVDAPGRLSRRQLATMHATGAVELGAHGLGHFHLDELSPELVMAEVRGSKTELERLIDGPITSFAYPYGAYDSDVRSAVKRAGYRAAAAVKDAVSHNDDDPFAIARWTVVGGTSPDRIAQVLDGQNVPLAWPGLRLRTQVGRALRRARARAPRPSIHPERL